METTSTDSKPSVTISDGVRKFSKKEHEYFDVDKLVSREPYGQFRHWFQEVENLQIDEAHVFTLATANKSSIPSCRTLRLANIIDAKGFTFYSSFDSRKGKEMEENPYASMCFWWPSTDRAVRIDGQVKKLSNAESEDYFLSLPRHIQLGIVVNVQCEPIISNRQQLLDVKMKYSNETKIQKPDRWGGYLLIPHTVEFFQRQRDWMSDRIQFHRLRENDDGSVVDIDKSITHQGDDGWVFERMAP